MDTTPAEERVEAEAAAPPTPSIKTERIAIAVAWVGFLVGATFLAPGDPNDAPEIFKIFNGQLADVNDVFFAVFNLVGATAWTYVTLLYPGAKRQERLPFAPFAIGGTFIGMAALGPYLFGRTYTPQLTKEDVERGPLSRWLESRANALLTLVYALWGYFFALGLFTPGSERLHDLIFYSSLVDMGRLLQSDRFVFTTTLDFAALSLCLWGPLTEDMRRRGWFIKGKGTESVLTALSILSTPGLGPAFYLLLRPRLPEKIETAPANKKTAEPLDFEEE